MGLRVKVALGVVLLVVIFGFRFICVNCQQVVADAVVVVEDHIQPQAWHQPAAPTEITMDSEINVSSYQSPTQTWPGGNQTSRKRRRPGGRKRRRRPQEANNHQNTESNEYSNNYYWEGQVHNEELNNSFIISFYNSTHYYSSTESNSEESQELIKRHYIQPKQRTEKVREPLAALEQEQRLSDLRNKQRRNMSTEEPALLGQSYRDKSYRKLYSQAKRKEDTISQDPTSSATDLKDILKNSGGLSLSEILQQKNLSLDDLIKGKQNALLALQTPATPTNDPNSKYMKPIRPIPFSDLSSRTTSTTTTSTESPSWEIASTEYVPHIAEINQSITSENLIQDYSTNTSLKYFTVSSQLPTRKIEDDPKSTPYPSEILSTAQQIYDSVDEDVQETQSSFNTVLTTQPSYRKRVTIKPFRINNTVNVPKDSSSSSESDSDEKHFNKSLRDRSGSSSQESSIESDLHQKEPETNFIEKFATFEEAKPKDVATIEELFRPLYQKKDNNNLFEAITSRVDVLNGKHFNKALSDATESPVIFTDVDATHDVDDRTDILELLEDRRSGSRLVKVLAQRNMSLDELIQHRQRGSSQLHLSEYIQNKTGTPTKAFSIKPQILDEKLDIVTAFDNFPHFNLGNLKSIKPDEIKTDSQGSSYFTSIIDIKPISGADKSAREMKSLTFEPVYPTAFIASGEDKSIDFYAQPWKSFAIPVSYSSNSQETSSYIDQPAAEASAQVSQSKDTEQTDKLDTVAQIEDEVARAHDILDLELSGHGLRRSPIIQNGEIPLGVKSAVTASSIIVIFSLAIFLIIFVACRWKQKRRKKLTYIDNYNAMKKTHLPIISTQSTMKRIEPPMLSSSTPSSSTGTRSTIFTGAKSHKINTMDPNSPEVQEYLFDAMRKPF